MANVHCKKCNTEIDLDHAYHAREKGFLCERCHSDARRNYLIAMLIVFAGMGLIWAVSSSGNDREQAVDYSSYSMNSVSVHDNITTDKSVKYTLGGEIPEGKELGVEWHDKYEYDISSLIRNTPAGYDFSSEGIENWNGLVIREESGVGAESATILIEHPVKGLVTFTIETVIKTK